jgi:hypothetical protein
MVRISPGQTEATLDLEVQENLILSGRVLLDGEPLAGAQIAISAGVDDEHPSYVQTAYDGTFLFDVEKPGLLILKLPKGPGKGVVRSLQLEESQEIVIELSSESN